MNPDVYVLQPIIRKYWVESFKDNPLISGNTPVSSGDVVKDSFMYHLEVDHGIKICMDETGYLMSDFAVVDEKKFMWFMMRWQ